MKNEWKEWLYFSKSERRGIALLLFLLASFVFLPKLFPFFKKEQTQVDFEARYEEFAKEQQKLSTAKKWENNTKYKEKESLNDAVKVSPKAEQVTPVKEDAAEEKTSEAENSSTKTKEASTLKNTYKPKAQAEPIVLNINTASAEDFAKLRGIGEVYSNRIVKYRNKLGGFISVEQVGTTYGIEPDTFNSIKSQLILQNDFQPKKINLNTATVAEMKSHPYISEKLAQQAVNYREKVHPFKTKEDVMSLYFMNEELFGKLQPYLVW